MPSLVQLVRDYLASPFQRPEPRRLTLGERLMKAPLTERCHGCRTRFPFDALAHLRHGDHYCHECLSAINNWAEVRGYPAPEVKG